MVRARKDKMQRHGSRSLECSHADFRDERHQVGFKPHVFGVESPLFRLNSIYSLVIQTNDIFYNSNRSMLLRADIDTNVGGVYKKK
jgi:hypothetical protein